jgi:chemotaxis protein CheD
VSSQLSWKPPSGAPGAQIPRETEDPALATAHFLHAGQVFISTESQAISIILGSCVAVCVWDRVKAIGGATHFLLPNWGGRGVSSPRYGDVAVSVLLHRLLEAGADRGQLRAKVFGGGCLFDSLRKPSSNPEPHLGSRNVETALHMLAKARIPVVSKVVGVNRGQRIRFRTDTGDAVIRIL